MRKWLVGWVDIVVVLFRALRDARGWLGVGGGAAVGGGVRLNLLLRWP